MIKNLVGERFGHWAVIGKVNTKPPSKPKWLCLCDCGALGEVRTCHLLGGKSTQCRACADRAALKKRQTHGMTHVDGYVAWKDMKQRCYNPNHKSYKYYGGRGISVCAEWLNDPAKFISDMGPRPFPGAELDRIDNNGNYSPGNCRWCTRRENVLNSSKCKSN